MVVKTFRGLLAHGGQDRIRLSTIKGKVGYKIVKFQVIGNTPGSANYEAIVQVWKTLQTTVTGAIDFTQSNLLGVGMWSSSTSAEVYAEDMSIIFDNEVINQDIYITSNEPVANGSVNYYIELEAIELSDMAAEYTTIKNIRANS